MGVEIVDDGSSWELVVAGVVVLAEGKSIGSVVMGFEKSEVDFHGGIDFDFFEIFDLVRSSFVVVDEVHDVSMFFLSLFMHDIIIHSTIIIQTT